MLANMRLPFQQCLVVVLCSIITHAEDVQNGVNEFIDVSAPSNPCTWRTRHKVKYVCAADKLVGITLLVSTDLGEGQFDRVYQKFWRCHASEGIVSLQIRRVRIAMDDDIAFRPSVFNKKSTVVESAKLVVWMVDDFIWWKLTDEERRHIHNWATTSSGHDVHMLPPYSRPFKTFRRKCAPWYWQPLQRSRRRYSDASTCPVEQVDVLLLSFPTVFNGKVYGIVRQVSKYIDPLLELRRTRSITSPRFSVELWLYIVDYCPRSELNAAQACLIIGHFTPEGQHRTPVLLINVEGKLQIEAVGPDLYTAFKTGNVIPKHQWVRLLLSFDERMWIIRCSYGKNLNTTHEDHALFPKDVAFNVTEGYFLLGGYDNRMGTFKGYMSRVKLYRGQLLNPDQLQVPKANDSMFRLDLGHMKEQCGQFRRWAHQRVNFYAHKAAIYQMKSFCPSIYRQLQRRSNIDPRLLSCPRRPGKLKQGEKRVARLLRQAAMRDGHVTTEEASVIAEKLFETVETSIEQHGLKNVHLKVPLLEQSACLGNKDAAYTLAVFLNNGVGTTVQEYKGLALLMQGVLKKHRLSTLALAHRHAMGSDGVPFDRDVAYMYYKDIGDLTLEDKEKHPEDQVATEMIRLMDEQTLELQTDEKGDIFMWLKHQAQQGVTSAQNSQFIGRKLFSCMGFASAVRFLNEHIKCFQVHLAHLYFWGSQGMHRNLQAARHLYQELADQGDPDSQFTLGLMDYLGQGSKKKNKSGGKERIMKAAEKKQPNAVCALGWIALEQEKDFPKAAALFEEAYEMNFLDAGYYLGHMYQNGIYPDKPKDIDRAVSLYEWSAVRGHVTAALLYAYYQSIGTGTIPRSSYIAMEWARFIAEKNSAIGALLRDGVDTYRDGNTPLAAYYYLLSSEAGPEVASFNLAWLCEERKETVTAAISKECQWRHYNLTLQREQQFVDPYSHIKMGDYFWYGCQGQRNVSLAADYYAAAGRKGEPHALFNLAFMTEEGAEIPTSIWRSLQIRREHYTDKVKLLSELYERCRESDKSEAFIPCSLALYRVWLTDLWDRYHVYFKTSTYIGCAVAVLGTIYFVSQCISRFRQHRIQLYRLEL